MFGLGTRHAKTKPNKPTGKPSWNIRTLYREDAQLKDVLEKYYIKLTPKNSRVSASLAKTYKR